MSASPATESSSLEEFRRLYAERLAEQQALERAARYRDVPALARLWLALAPCWTVELAERCGMPAGDGGLARMLAGLEQAGVLTAGRAGPRARPGNDATVYTMTEAGRAEVLAEALAGSAGPESLAQAVANLGRMLDGAAAFDPEAPLPARRWAALAAQFADPAALVTAFESHVGAAFAALAPGELLNWLEAARPLAALLDGRADPRLDLALQRAARRLELLHRRVYDEQQLEYFLEREEQMAAFRALMEGSNGDPWALHFAGVGGVGKTMLVRHIAARLADRWGAVTARIDFDYLNPDYPRLSPGLLLWAFGQELRAHDPSGYASRLFDRADALLRDLHQRLHADRPVGGRGTDDPLFRSALAIYLDGFRSLSRRVILIVDTCEELAKVGPRGAGLENVEETFRIVQALHDGPESLDGQPASARGLGSLRVVFAGRRPLATAGAGWGCPEAAPLPPRPYLRLHEIRGFTPREAHAFLSERAGVPAPLIEPVIAASRRDVGHLRRFTWVDPVPAAPEEARCNPFELRLYADWAKEQPPPAPADIAAASSDRYVDERIIRRLRDGPLEALLPLLAILGRVDVDTLQAVRGWDAATAARHYERLAQQEWISQRFSSSADGKTRAVLDVEPGIRDQLFAHFAEHGGTLVEAQRPAADYLERVSSADDLATLTWDTFDAALRALALDADRGRVARWWRGVEARLLAQRDFRWALQLTRFLQGEHGAVGDGDTPGDRRASAARRLRPAVLATYASALLHDPSPPAADLAAIWREVAAEADQLPDAAEGARLRLRGLAGTIAAAHASGTPPAPYEVRAFWSALRVLRPEDADGPLVAALVAATEALVEQAERQVSEQAERLDAAPAASALLQVDDGAGAAAPPSPGPLLVAGLVEGVRLRVLRAALPAVLRAGPLSLLQGLRRRAGLPAAPSRDLWSEPDAALQGLWAFSCTLAARSLLLAGDRGAADAWFERALAAAPATGPAARPALWTDWLPPEDLPARVRLELARASYPARLSPSATLDRLGAWTRPPTTVDSERLHSAILRLELAREPVLAPRLRALGLELASGWLVWQGPTGPPLPLGLASGPAGVRCNALRVVPPLFVTVAEVLVAAGQVDAGLALLQPVASQTTSGYDLETVRHSERALTRIVRRMRLRDEGERGGLSLATSPLLADRALLWTLDGLDGDKQPGALGSPPLPPPDLPPAPWLHAIWRTRFALDADGSTGGDRTPGQDALSALLRPSGAGAATRGDRRNARLVGLATWAHQLLLPALSLDQDVACVAVAVAALRLDLVEAAELMGGVRPTRLELMAQGIGPDEAAALADGFQVLAQSANAIRAGFDVGAWWLAHGELPEEALTLWLRARALGSARGEPPDDLVERVGRRRAADVALEEGELLALRLPERAGALLQRAADYFRAAGDNAGVVIAATAGTLARVAGRDSDATVELLQEVEPAYRRLQAALAMPEGGEPSAWERVGRLHAPGPALSDPAGAAPPARNPPRQLPSWEHLWQLAASPSRADLTALAPRSWRPWLVRRVAVLDARGGPTGRLPLGPRHELWDWVAENYGASLAAGEGSPSARPAVAVPADLAVPYARSRPGRGFQTAGSLGTYPQETMFPAPAAPERGPLREALVDALQFALPLLLLWLFSTWAQSLPPGPRRVVGFGALGLGVAGTAWLVWAFWSLGGADELRRLWGRWREWRRRRGRGFWLATAALVLLVALGSLSLRSTSRQAPIAAATAAATSPSAFSAAATSPSATATEISSAAPSSTVRTTVSSEAGPAQPTPPPGATPVPSPAPTARPAVPAGIIAGVAGAIALLALAAVCWRRAGPPGFLRRYRLARSSLELRVAAADPAIPGATLSRDTLAVALTLSRRSPGRAFWPWPPFRQRTAFQESRRADVSRLAPYRRLAAVWSPGQAAEVARVAAAAGPRPVEVLVNAGAGALPGACWEALVALPAIDRMEAVAGLPFRFRREAPTRRAATTDLAGRGGGAGRREVQVAGLVGDEAERRLVEAGWRALTDGGRGRVRTRSDAPLPALAGEPAPAVLHLVGVAEEISGGVRFCIGDASAATAAQAAVMNPHVLRAEDVGFNFPDLALCILQGSPRAAWAPPPETEPGESLSLPSSSPAHRRRAPRLETDRYEAMLVRTFAQELYALAVPAVVVLPPLEPALAGRLLEELVDALLRGGRRGAPVLPAALSRAQALILADAGLDREAALEAALDVCLYADAGWDARLLAWPTDEPGAVRR